VYLEEMLTFDLFLKVYQNFKDNGEEVDVPDQKSKFIPLVFQLIVCEDKIYQVQN
jgi:hypothetical protein